MKNILIDCMDFFQSNPSIFEAVFVSILITSRGI